MYRSDFWSIRYGRNMGLRYTVRVPLHLSGVSDDAAALELARALTSAQAGRPDSSAPSLSRPIEVEDGPVTAYLEVDATGKAAMERCVDVVLADVRALGIVAAGPITILSVRASS